MKRILAVILFFAAATSLALVQTADKQEKTNGDKSWLRLVDHLYFVADHDDHHLAQNNGNSSTPLARTICA